MINDSEALDAMHEIIKRWNADGGSISTEELAAMAGKKYTVHNGNPVKFSRKCKISHKFGRVVETGGHFWVAVGLHDRWLMDDTYGPVIVERYNALKDELRIRNNKRNSKQ